VAPSPNRSPASTTPGTPPVYRPNSLAPTPLTPFGPPLGTRTRRSERLAVTMGFAGTQVTSTGAADRGTHAPTTPPPALVDRARTWPADGHGACERTVPMLPQRLGLGPGMSPGAQDGPVDGSLASHP
jgi:hypothetical protein